jgi:hypothetical protein
MGGVEVSIFDCDFAGFSLRILSFLAKRSSHASAGGVTMHLTRHPPRGVQNGSTTLSDGFSGRKFRTAQERLGKP